MKNTKAHHFYKSVAFYKVKLLAALEKIWLFKSWMTLGCGNFLSKIVFHKHCAKTKRTLSLWAMSDD